jgi:hypothetical protein
MATKLNKKRNTGFVFEALIREATKAILAKDEGRRNKVVTTIKESFAPGTELRKELDCYRALSSEDTLDKPTAEKLIFEVRRDIGRINEKKLIREKNTLVSRINKNISKDVFNNFVPNYKSLATIARIFNDKTPTKDRILMESVLLETLTKQIVPENKEDLKHIDSLVVKSFVKSFNNQYDDLLAEQRSLLQHYVTSVNDGQTSFKFYINEELIRIKEIIQKSLTTEEVSKDEIMVENTNRVLTLIEEMRQVEIDSTYLMKLLKLQKLASECENDD